MKANLIYVVLLLFGLWLTYVLYQYLFYDPEIKEVQPIAIFICTLFYICYVVIISFLKGITNNFKF